MDEELRKILYKKMLDFIKEDASKKKCCKANGNSGEVEVYITRDFLNAVNRCKVTVVFFYSPTCPYCRAYAPTFATIADEYGDKAAFVRVNVSRNPDIAAYYNVMGVPTTMIFVEGAPLGVLPGLIDYDTLQRAVEYALQKAGCKFN